MENLQFQKKQWEKFKEQVRVGYVPCACCRTRAYNEILVKKNDAFVMFGLCEKCLFTAGSGKLFKQNLSNYFWTDKEFDPKKLEPVRATPKQVVYATSLFSKLGYFRGNEQKKKKTQSFLQDLNMREIGVIIGKLVKQEEHQQRFSFKPAPGNAKFNPWHPKNMANQEYSFLNS